jgi:hypothetical protein
MVTIVPALVGLCCDGAHVVTQTPPYAVLAIESTHNAYICLCLACARQLAEDIEALLAPA